MLPSCRQHELTLPYIVQYPLFATRSSSGPASLQWASREEVLILALHFSALILKSILAARSLQSPGSGSRSGVRGFSVLSSSRIRLVVSVLPGLPRGSLKESCPVWPLPFSISEQFLLKVSNFLKTSYKRSLTLSQSACLGFLIFSWQTLHLPPTRTMWSDSVDSQLTCKFLFLPTMLTM